MELWEAVKRTRPKLHVFGHIHEAWGAAVVKWKSEDDKNGNGEVESAKVLEDRRGVEEGWKDSKEERKRKEEKAEKIVKDGYYHLKYDRGEDAEQTLFVNAAVMYAPGYVPWLVDVELPRNDGDGKEKITMADQSNGEANTRPRECLSTNLQHLEL